MVLGLARMHGSHFPQALDAPQVGPVLQFLRGVGTLRARVAEWRRAISTALHWAAAGKAAR